MLFINKIIRSGLLLEKLLEIKDIIAIQIKRTNAALRLSLLLIKGALNKKKDDPPKFKR
jgi:hypothetical protein